MNARLQMQRPAFDSSRLLALSRFLQKGAREYETEVRGGSMGVALPNGSHIRIRFVPDVDLVEGDVIAFVAQNRILAHRVVRRTTSRGAPYLLTRGDATILCDPPVPVSAMIGVVKEYEDGGVWRPVTRSRQLHSQGSAALLARMVELMLKISPGASRWTALFFVRAQWVWKKICRVFV